MAAVINKDYYHLFIVRTVSPVDELIKVKCSGRVSVIGSNSPPVIDDILISLHYVCNKNIALIDLKHSDNLVGNHDCYFWVCKRKIAVKNWIRVFHLEKNNYRVLLMRLYMATEKEFDGPLKISK